MNRKFILSKLRGFPFFLLLSAVFWFFGKMMDTYTYIQPFTLDISQVPPELEFLQPPPAILEARLRLSGFQILKNRFFPPGIKLNFNRFAPLPKGKYYFIPNNHLRDFQKQYYQWDWVRVYPDSLILRLSKRTRKKVRVTPDITFTFTPGYQLVAPVEIIPDSVVLHGPAEVLKNISSVAGQPVVKRDIDADFQLSVPLNIPSAYRKKITLSENKILIKGRVKRYTESQTLVPVAVGNNTHLRVLPEAVTLKYLVPFDKYQEVKAEDFTVKPEMRFSVDEKTPVRIERMPDYIKLLRIIPDSVRIWKHNTKSFSN